MPGRKGMIALTVLCVCFALTMGIPAAHAKPIKLGALFVMSGKLGGYGKSGWQAIQLVVDEINVDVVAGYFVYLPVIFK